MIARALERAARAALETWRHLSIDAKVVAAVAVFNWLLLFANHTTVADTRDLPLWRLFPQGWDALFLIACGVLGVTYALRDKAPGCWVAPNVEGPSRKLGRDHRCTAALGPGTRPALIASRSSVSPSTPE